MLGGGGDNINHLYTKLEIFGGQGMTTVVVQPAASRAGVKTSGRSERARKITL